MRRIERKEILRVFRTEGQTNLAALRIWLLREEERQRGTDISILKDRIFIPVVYIGNTRSEIDQWYASLNLEMLLLICEALICKFLI